MYTLKKSLGQHFLKDENICKKIVASLEPCDFENLLEIGPGAGALTKHLLTIPNIDFKAVEVDAEKVDYLVATFPPFLCCCWLQTTEALPFWPSGRLALTAYNRYAPCSLSCFQKLASRAFLAMIMRIARHSHTLAA